MSMLSTNQQVQPAHFLRFSSLFHAGSGLSCPSLQMQTPTVPRRVAAHLIMSGVLVMTGGCAAVPPNASGSTTVNINPGIAGPVQGVGIEGQDVIGMSDQMMRDMLVSPQLVQVRQGKSPRVIVDAQYFANDSAQPINRNLITDRLRVALNRAAQGRMTFVGRQYMKAVEDERALKRTGTTDVGTTGMTRATLGGDYRLGGRIASLDQKSARSGLIQRYTQITFEMFDLESGEIVWSGIYEFARAAADDVVYR
jgi:penicillin-binding protein activator